MIVRRHEVPDRIFSALARGGGGSPAIQYLASVEYSKHLLLLRSVVDISERHGHPQYQYARRAYDLLAEIQGQASNDVGVVLRYPSVGAWASRTVFALQGGQPRTGAEPLGLASIAAAAAVRSRFSCAIEVPVFEGMITLPSLGQAIMPGSTVLSGTAVLRSGPHGAELISGGYCIPIPDDTHADAPGWRGLRSIEAQYGGKSIRLLIDDLDPFRMPAPFLGMRLAEQEARSLQSCLNEAWRLLVRQHRARAEEVSGCIKVLTPLTAPSGGQVSASSRETFGCIGLSSPADPLAFAVTLAHEVQHAKLSALLDTLKLTLPDDGKLYYAPWRDDPRPVSALLQGAFAYLGVTCFWRRQRHEEKGAAALTANTEFARWRSAVMRTTRTLLASGRLTFRGQEFVSGMATTVRELSAEPVPEEAVQLARRDAGQHAELWRLRHDAAELI